MAPMPRLLALTLVAALVSGLAAACGGEAVTPSSTVAPSPSVSAPTSASPSVSPSPPASPSPSVSPHIEVPSDAPTTFAQAADVEQVPIRALLPPHAQAVSVWRLGPPDVEVAQLAVAWRRGNVFSAQNGFAVWQAFAHAPAWRIVYAFTDDPSAGVLGVRFETGDLTGDGVPDVLTFEDLGGSGACGVWRVVASGPGSATEIYRKQTCDTDVRISGGDLVVRESVYEPGDAHCCPSRFRTTTLEWDGAAWQVIDEVVEPA
jgi:hypothetical protein